MDNITQNSNIQLIENKIKEIIKRINNHPAVDEIENIKKELQNLDKENNQMKQRVISYTAALMHQRRKAAENVDDQYFEHEIFIEAHEELGKEIEKQLEKLNKLN